MNLSQCKYYLEQKILLVQDLLKVTGNIMNQIQEKNFDTIEDQFLRRQQIIEMIDHVDEVYKHKCDLEQAMTNGYREEILQLRGMLLKIQEMDQELLTQIPAISQELSTEYNKAKTARKVRTAYEGGEGQNAHFLDRQR